MAPFYLIYRHGRDNENSYFIVCLGAFLLFLIPQLIVHLRYYQLDKGRSFYYTPERQQLLLRLKNGREFEFSFDDIESLERSKSIPLAENRMLWFPWDSYNYSIVRLKNGQQFVITSLLVPNMDLPLEESKIKLRKRFYCYPFGVKEVRKSRKTLLVI
jgi:hypothetical protein